MKIKPYLDKVSGEYITEGLTPQDGADSISDFDTKFSFASFTWNGDDKTGAKCAKQTKKQIKQYLLTKIDQEVKKRDKMWIKKSVELFESYKKEAIFVNEPVFLRETERQLEHLNKFNKHLSK